MPYHLRGIGPHRKAKHPNNDYTTPNLTGAEALRRADLRSSNTYDIAQGIVPSYDELFPVIPLDLGLDAEGMDTADLDPVNHPPHYGGGNDPYEAIKVIHAWGLGFDLGNVLKYIRRADLKGTPIQDLEKAKFYLEDEIKRRKEVAATTAATPNAQT
jgi:hypothetical protein